MNRALVVALLRQRLASPMRVALLALFVVPGMGGAILARSLAPASGSAYWLALVLAAGAIGQDVSSGVLHLTFARPVTRPAYVISRWFAAAAGAFALAMAQLLPVVALLALQRATPAFPEVAAVTLENLVMAATAAAVMTCFSSLADGLGDVGLLALVSFSLQLGHMLAQVKYWTAVDGVVVELQQTLLPEVSFAWLGGQGSPAWTGLATAASTIVLALAIAIVRVNRKELSYAAG